MKMFGNAKLGRQGKRSYTRLRLGIPAGLILTHEVRSCLIDNVSCSGAQVRTEIPLRPGSQVMLKLPRHDALCIVTWTRGIQCGLRFDRMLSTSTMERLRWIANNPVAHQRQQWSSARID